MSMQNPSPDIPVFAAIRPAGRRQRGFGLVQVMLILVLVGGALAAGAMLLQSKRPVQQAVTQEQTLRWADEAVAAFAASNARLPCPSPTVHGEEDCTGVNAQGWLPLRTLLGASGTGPQIGPVAYMVYRGGESAHLDLTRPGNAYQPPLIDGSPREIITKDKDGKETGRRRFAAVNGLDLCRSLELAEAAGLDSALARITNQAHVPRNVAYGIAAAGSHAGSTRLDDANAGAGQTMEAPWRQWDSGYDDRVRVRTFDRLGQALGCRLLAGGSGPSSGTPYNVSLAGMDVLAAAVTLHDALAVLQTNNMDATEAALQGAIKAQVSLIFKLVTTAASLSDQITTLVTAAANLTRSIATCIASLGAMCWEVPLKAAAVGTSIAGLGTKGVTLAAKAASLPFVALALDASVKARDLAKKNGPKAPPQDLDEARKELECTLWARNCTDPDYETVWETDSDGNPVQERDAKGDPVYDEYGNPVFVVKSRTEVPRVGLERQVEIAREEWETLKKQADLLERWRLGPFGRGATEDGALVELTSTAPDGQLRSRIHERIDPVRTCGNSTDWERCPAAYRRAVQETVCVEAATPPGRYNAGCTQEVTETVEENGASVTRYAGTHDLVQETRYEFDWTTATAHAVARRAKAEAWTDLNLREGELKRELDEFNNNIKTWFEGSDSILAKMKKQRDDQHHCQGLSEPSLPSGEMQRLQCINARNAVRYIETCEKPVVVTQCRFLGNGAGRYVDDACTRRDGLDASGNALPKDYGLQETSGDTYVRDTNELATCKPNMEARRDGLTLELQGLSARRTDAARDYAALPSPWIGYPTRTLPASNDHTYDWFEWAIEVKEDQDGNPLEYNWIRSAVQENYKAKREVWVPEDTTTDPKTDGYWKEEEYIATRSLPWYAREPWGSSDPSHLGGSSPLLVTSGFEIYSKNVCRYFNSRQWHWSGYWWWPGSDGLSWWGDTRNVGLYCQRYPYNRAFEDWRRAKVGAVNAWKNYQDTLKQYEKLKQEYDDMQAGHEAGGGTPLGMSFGAEAALEHADSRGSSGPQALP